MNIIMGILWFLFGLYFAPVFTLMLTGTLAFIFVVAWMYCGLQR